MKQNNKLSNWPYSPLFMVGIIYALIGTILWPLVIKNTFFLNQIIEFHRLIMIGGFFYSFAAGFILTAFPNFTQTKKVQDIEMNLILISQSMILYGLIEDNYKFSLICFLISNIILFFFLLLRLKNKKMNPPKSFRYAFIGIIMAVIFCLIEIFDADNGFKNFSLHLLEYGVVLNFILAVGLKIFPVLLGNINQFQFKIDRNVKNKFIEYFNRNKNDISIVLLNLLLIYNFFFDDNRIDIFRGLLILFILQDSVKIFQRPKSKTYLTFAIWLSLLAIPIGIFLRSFASLNVFALHLYLISGLGLLTFMIAGRVTLSHGGFSLDFERSEKFIWINCLLFITAALCRFLPSVVNFIDYEISLNIAVIFWGLGIISWLKVFGAKLIAPILNRSSV